MSLDFEEITRGLLGVAQTSTGRALDICLRRETCPGLTKHLLARIAELEEERDEALDGEDELNALNIALSKKNKALEAEVARLRAVLEDHLCVAPCAYCAALRETREIPEHEEGGAWLSPEIDRKLVEDLCALGDDDHEEGRCADPRTRTSPQQGAPQTPAASPLHSAEPSSYPPRNTSDGVLRAERTQE